MRGGHADCSILEPWFTDNQLAFIKSSTTQRVKSLLEAGYEDLSLVHLQQHTTNLVKLTFNKIMLMIRGTVMKVLV